MTGIFCDGILGGMTLDRYLTDTKIKEAAFARDAGLTQPTINKLRHGISRPSLKAMLAIKAASKGAVELNDWTAQPVKVRA